MNSKIIEFRDFSSADMNLLKAVFQDPQIMEYTLDDCFSDVELKNYHKSILENNMSSKRKTFEFAIFNSDTFIGFADFTIFLKNDFGGIAEFGYLLLPKYWGKGFGTIIAKQLIQMCFNQHQLHRVYAKCNSHNLGSIKVLEKNGMKLEGTLKKQRFKRGQWMDENIYALLNPNLPCI